MELERDQLILQVKEEIDAREKLAKQLAEDGKLVNQLSADVAVNNGKQEIFFILITIKSNENVINDYYRVRITVDNQDDGSVEKFYILQNAMEKLQVRTNILFRNSFHLYAFYEAKMFSTSLYPS